MYVILVYDISLDEQGKRVLPKVFKICKKFLTHIQNSVFEGELSEGQSMRLRSELNRVIRRDKDSIILFSSRDQRWLDKQFWGKHDDAMSTII